MVQVPARVLELLAHSCAGTGNPRVCFYLIALVTLLEHLRSSHFLLVSLAHKNSGREWVPYGMQYFRVGVPSCAIIASLHVAMPYGSLRHSATVCHNPAGFQWAAQISAE